MVWGWVFVFILIQPCWARTAPHVPELLEPWVKWVLHGQEAQLECIPHYDDASVYQCAWPSALSISLTDQGGRFEQSWLVHRETWVPLPGSSLHWPREVRVDGEPWTVIRKNQVPGVLLQAGTHTTSGIFVWKGVPENLQVPPESALVSLTMNHEPVLFPHVDSQGRVWFKQVQTPEKIENRLKIESFRLITDAIPCEVLVSFTLDVAGSAREIFLGPLYSPEILTPLSLQSPLPARLEQDGRLRMQVRAGQYQIALNLRHTGPLTELSFAFPEDGLWPREELWSFVAQPDIRQVEIKGVPPVDPAQTSLPQEWHAYPAYRILPGESMAFKEIKRGDPLPAPDQMALDRTLWLRFDGSGYTLQDRIVGRKNTDWRLEMDPMIMLGRVEVDGQDQLITRQAGSPKAGIELRNGRINLTADSVFQGNIAALPATGWDHDFQKVAGRLHLPPGWKLIHAAGIDQIPRTWIKQWTLLDFFIVLIFTIALAKLFSKPLACVAFFTLVLIFHEPGAPVYVWLALLIGFALLKYLPQGKFKKMVQLYQIMALLTLAAIAIPYAVGALRMGIYPQLERPWTSMIETAQRPSPRKTLPLEGEPEMVQDQMSGKGAPRLAKVMEQKTNALESAQRVEAPSAYYGSQVLQYDPKALTQTGPGLPQWVPFETIQFNWSGPVTRDQSISFTLIGPRINMVLAFVRVFLILALSLGMLGGHSQKGKGINFSQVKSLKIFSFLVLFLVLPLAAKAGEIPPPQMLEALQQRLLERDDCFPFCADIPEVQIHIGPDHLSLDAQVHVTVASAIPVPGHPDQWLPQKVHINGVPAMGLIRKEDTLWVMVGAGVHQLSLSGPIRNQNLLQIAFPLKPHTAVIQAEGWSVEGAHADGRLDNQLQFKRIVEQESKQPEVLETGVLPPFVQVERTLLLGLEWKIQTRVTRMSPAGAAIVLDIPLIPGESVTTEGIRVKAGAAKINLNAHQNQLSWESFLEPGDEIGLTHAATHTWTEIWKVDVSPIFHLSYEGIPVILHKTGERWYPTWHPWPGEAVTLKISRPAGIDGQTLTIEKSHLELRPGQRTTAARLMLSLKSSQGGQHTLVLPPAAALQEVSIQGRLSPIRQEGQKVALPIVPGSQEIELKWLEPEGMKPRYTSSRVDLGAPSVNASVDIHLPGERWPLFMGGDPLVGPAVLFWSVLMVVVLVAAGLSRTGWAQLKFRHWLLLGIGLSMSHLAAGFMVVGWLIALDRRKMADSIKGHLFNLIQIGLAVLTLVALGSLVFAVSQGLLGHPDMNIVGNGSHTSLLRWYQDVSGPVLPRVWVVSIPMLVYRMAMLAWALWLSFWLVGILKWGWQRFSQPMIWQNIPFRLKKKEKEA